MSNAAMLIGSNTNGYSGAPPTVVMRTDETCDVIYGILTELETNPLEVMCDISSKQEFIRKLKGRLESMPFLFRVTRKPGGDTEDVKTLHREVFIRTKAKYEHHWERGDVLLWNDLGPFLHGRPPTKNKKGSTLGHQVLEDFMKN